MTRIKYILAAGLLISLVGLAVGQVDNNTTFQENDTNDTILENDTGLTVENKTENQTMNETETNETENDTDNATVPGLTEDDDSNTTENQTENITTEDINESLETVILASTENYPDAMMSGPVAEEYGIPVLLTDSDNLSERTSDVIENADVENVIMVGGPSIISEDVEEEIEDEVETTTRLWGVTQVGTSNEIANYFYDEVESATVLNYEPYQDNDSYQLLSAAKEQAKMEDQPLLVTSGENLSNRTEGTLENLSVEEVDLYTTREEGNTSEQLEDMDIETNVRSGDIDNLTSGIYENLTEDGLNDSVHFVGAENFSSAISAPAYLEGPSIGIYSEDDISDSIEFLNDSQISETDITGDENLVDSIESEIQEIQDDIETRTLVGSSPRIAAQLLSLNIDTWNQTQEDTLDDFEQTIEEQELEDELEELQDRTRQPAEEGENATENQTEDIDELLNDAEEALDDNELVLAKARLAEARSELEKDEFSNLSQEEIEERVNEELSIASIEGNTTAQDQNETENQTMNETENESGDSLLGNENETESNDAQNNTGEEQSAIDNLTEELNTTGQ